jgi:hypothetical protein
MPVPNSDPLQHEIGLEKENGVTIALFPQPASETRLGKVNTNGQCGESGARSRRAGGRF